MIGKTISHYKILEKIGEGGMGVVYKAQDTKLDRIVALKFLPERFLCDEEAKKRFIQEAKAASALNHANITTIHEIDEVQGKCFISMEYVEGKSIREVVKGRSLSIEEILKIAIQTCEGLIAAHEKKIVHRDMKSDNVMLTSRGQVKIMDFGLAKLMGATKLTSTGSALGTVAYMSPEQVQGEEVDQGSDIFSFGVTLYEMITGQLPFKGDHEAAIIYSIVNEDPEPLTKYRPNVSERLQRIVDKTLSKKKIERYQHINDLLADFRREEKGLTHMKVAKVLPDRGFPKRKKKVFPLVIPASIVFILVLVYLILRPFKIQIIPEKNAVAEEKSLAIMYFENVADPEDKDRTARMITSLMITDLSESQYIQVLSRQRLFDILKDLRKEELKTLDQSVASEVARKAGAKWILTGDILQIEPHIVLTADISELATGKILTTRKVTGETNEDLFSVVDKLSALIKEDLSPPEVVKQETDRSVADVTTYSPDAYRYYVEGLDYESKLYYAEAEKSYRKALEFDSTFAMAFYRLASLKRGWEQERYIYKAVQYLGKVSRKEEYYIRSLQAIVSGDYTEASKQLQKIIERYPEEREAFYWLGVISQNVLDQHDKVMKGER